MYWFYKFIIDCNNVIYVEENFVNENKKITEIINNSKTYTFDSDNLIHYHTDNMSIHWNNAKLFYIEWFDIPCTNGPYQYVDKSIEYSEKTMVKYQSNLFGEVYRRMVFDEKGLITLNCYNQYGYEESISLLRCENYLEVCLWNNRLLISKFMLWCDNFIPSAKQLLPTENFEIETVKIINDYT